MKFDESLLTAYLDGELTDEELALVERQLAQNPAHRETLRELAQLQQQLAALPAESFSTDVVAEVRRRIAAGPAVTSRALQDEPHAAGPDAPDAVEPGAAKDARWTPARNPVRSEGGSLGWRLWVPLALAAGLLAVVGLTLLRQPVEVAVSERVSRHGAAPQQSASQPTDSEQALPLDVAAELDDQPPGRNLERTEAEELAESTPFSAEARGALAAPSVRGAAAPSEPGVPAPTGVRPSVTGDAESEDDALAAGGMGGAAAGAEMRRQRQTADLQRNYFDERLPERTRLYRFSAANRQLLEQRRNQGLERMGEGLFASDAAPAAAPIVALKVPAGEVAETLDWMSDRLAAGKAVEEPTGDAAALEQTEAALMEVEEPSAGGLERPAAIWVEAPPEQIGHLLEEVRRWIGRRYGNQAASERQLERDPVEAFSGGAAIFLIEPAGPQ